ncbi:MAG TPA: valine--tRNA ligase [Actinomycetota bacterium]|nr:valine--tRNA ligase [Actinomycetota bacterium]
MTMPSAYEPSEVEGRLYRSWVARGYFHAEPDDRREPFCIVLPPPNVTGALHIGHALDHTIQDVLVRRRRMQGYAALWLPGTDHAGIGTEVLVARQLLAEGVDKREIGREVFVERVWEWRERYGDRIVEQMKALGNSCDWDRLRFTMDEGLQHAVRVAFVRLYEDDLIYRGERIINWCPTDQTALSDSEVEHESVEGELITFRYPLGDGDGYVDAATTRVETMLGDTGIAVHPDDTRYASLVGRSVRHPLDGRKLPIVADAAVDPAFGTGAVKVTPAHDPNDFEIAERRGLEARNILEADATLNDLVPEEFRGLDRYEARRAVRDRLDELGLLVEEERPYVHSVGHCYRCRSEIEPWLSGKQWFVKVEPLKGPAMEAAEAGKLTFFPARWRDRYLEWLEGLRDWNISRQLWWGHRIPVWYCPKGHEFASVEDPDACAECGSTEIEQDPDVLDTWFSSQLWPFSTLGWPEDTEDLRYFYPTSVLVTGYEILYLWVARMVMAGIRLAGDVPFHDVVIHGLVRDAQGRKMSKSLGNVIDPLDMIERYGADALRFSLSRMASPEQQNLPLSEDQIEAGKHFANKLWNAARLVRTNLEGDALELPPSARLTVIDRWLLSRAEACRQEVDAAIETYRFADAAQALYRFLWSEYCDWGLEMAKPRLYEGSAEDRQDASSVLAWILERTLRLLHPIMPFVTEEIRQRFVGEGSIVIAPWPEPMPDHRDGAAEGRVGFAMDLVTAVRRFRSDHRVPPALELRVGVEGDDAQREILGTLSEEVRRLARIGSLLTRGADLPPSGAARLHVQGAEVLIPLEGVLDPEAECERLRGRLEAMAGEAEKAERKLANEGFVTKAPAEVVEEQRRRLGQLKEEEAALREQLDELGCG